MQMKPGAIPLLLLVVLLTLTSCGGREAEYLPGKSGRIAILSLHHDLQARTPGKQVMELQRVMSWMEKDLITELRNEGFETSFLKDMGNYSSSMGILFIINGEAFNAGRAGGIPSGEPGSGLSTLELSYRLLDERGALLAEWSDGAESRRGGTYCAQALNRRAMKKLETTLYY